MVERERERRLWRGTSGSLYTYMRMRSTDERRHGNIIGSLGGFCSVMHVTCVRLRQAGRERDKCQATYVNEPGSPRCCCCHWVMSRTTLKHQTNERDLKNCVDLRQQEGKKKFSKKFPPRHTFSHQLSINTREKRTERKKMENIFFIITPSRCCCVSSWGGMWQYSLIAPSTKTNPFVGLLLLRCSSKGIEFKQRRTLLGWVAISYISFSLPHPPLATQLDGVGVKFLSCCGTNEWRRVVVVDELLLLASAWLEGMWKNGYGVMSTFIVVGWRRREKKGKIIRTLHNKIIKKFCFIFFSLSLSLSLCSAVSNAFAAKQMSTFCGNLVAVVPVCLPSELIFRVSRCKKWNFVTFRLPEMDYKHEVEGIRFHTHDNDMHAGEVTYKRVSLCSTLS